MEKQLQSARRGCPKQGRRRLRRGKVRDRGGLKGAIKGGWGVLTDRTKATNMEEGSESKLDFPSFRRGPKTETRARRLHLQEQVAN